MIQYLEITLRKKIRFLLGKGFEQTSLCSSKCKLFQINIVVSKQLNAACIIHAECCPENTRHILQ